MMIERSTVTSSIVETRAPLKRPFDSAQDRPWLAPRFARVAAHPSAFLGGSPLASRGWLRTLRLSSAARPSLREGGCAPFGFPRRLAPRFARVAAHPSAFLGGSPLASRGWLRT